MDWRVLFLELGTWIPEKSLKFSFLWFLIKRQIKKNEPGT